MRSVDFGEQFILNELNCRQNSSDGVISCLESISSGMDNDRELSAILYINQQQYNKAIQELNIVLADNSTTATDRYHYLRAKALVGLGRYNTALPDLAKAVWLNPYSATYLQLQAYSFRKLRNLDEASFSLDKAVRLEPRNSRLYRDKGIILYKLGKMDESVMQLINAVELDGTLHSAHFYASLAYFELGRYQQALESVDKAIAISAELSKNGQVESGNPDYLTHRSIILTKLGHKEEAKRVQK